MKLFLKLFFILCALSMMQARAGGACNETTISPENVARAMELAYKTRNALDDSGAQVALIARVGQNLSKYRLRYSHLAYVWRDHPQGRWLVVHELNQCGTAQSVLYNEGLGNFFMDNMFAYETMILIPSSSVQTKIVAMLTSDVPLKLHSANYNMLAYPFSTEYQNSNQWVLETFAVASANDSKIRNRSDAQAWLKMAGYQPDTLTISTTERLGARLFRANIAFDDHPFNRRMAGKIDTVTVESLVRFVERPDEPVKKMVLTLKK